MDKRTFNALTQLNTHFYSVVADEFSDSRNAAWEGWQALLPALKKLLSSKETVSILDFGCGNGRFLEFIGEHVPLSQVKYTGIDNSDMLLAKAHQNVYTSNTSFIQSDVISPLFDSSKLDVQLPSNFDVVVSFGFLHHIPSQQARQNFFAALANLLNENGLAVVTAWQFTSIPSLLKRVTNPVAMSINADQLEEGDYILDWQRGANAYRFCHLATHDEVFELCKNANLSCVDSYAADGKTHNLNQYYVLKKSSPETAKS